MRNKEDFQTIFDKLKPILTSFADDLIVTTDEPGNYYLNTPFSEKYKKELFLAQPKSRRAMSVTI